MAEITNFKGQVIRLESPSDSDTAIADLQKLVAHRVRDARRRKRLSRRALSGESGVSERYLAQLEAGEGNISIALLLRVAMALEHRIEWLVGEDDPWSSDVIQAMELFRSADQESREAALLALQPKPEQNARANRVCLIGLRGAGKSTLGVLAAEKLGVPFLELNKEIESLGGMPVAEIIALYGQEGYRHLELKALDQVLEQHEQVILAAAGGIVAEPKTFHRLLLHYNTIWLKASAEEHMERVRAQGDERPMADNPGAMDQLKSILRNREALYSKADVHLDTSGKPFDLSLQDLVKAIKAHGFLDR